MAMNDILNRYKILFHDAPSSKIEPLIRKLIKEIKRKYDDDVFAIKVMEYERGLRDAKPKVSEEFIQQAIDFIAEYPSYKRLENKLIEAGVEVE